MEVLTSRAQTPSPEWERFVVTAKARARIRRFVRQRQRGEFAALGRSILQKIFAQEGYDVTDKGLEGVLKVFRVQSVDDLLAQVGDGGLGAKDVFKAVYPGHKPAAKTGNVVPIGRARGKSSGRKPPKTAAVPIRGLIPGMAVHLAGCCHPLPGDRIVGIVATGRGVTIHTIDCDNLSPLANEPERWLDLAWEDHQGEEAPYVGRLHAIIDNTPGSLGDICTLIGKQAGNISNMKFVHRSVDIFEVLLDIEVSDVRHLSNIVAALRASPKVSAVDRARG
ncbi:MAG: RelA/SpoT AH/RIS domain-containing protein [Pseudomonadota bacterium]